MTWKTAIEARMAKCNNMSKAELSRRSGLSKGYITDLLHNDESKRKKNPSFESIQAIAMAFGISGWKLWKEAGQ